MSDTFDHPGDAFYGHLESYGTFPKKSESVNFSWKMTELEKEIHERRIGRELEKDNLELKRSMLMKKLGIWYEGSYIRGCKYIDQHSKEDYTIESNDMDSIKKIDARLKELYLDRGLGGEPTHRSYRYFKLKKEAKRIADVYGFDIHDMSNISDKVKAAADFKRCVEIINQLISGNY
jgi:hypothetical protein